MGICSRRSHLSPGLLQGILNLQPLRLAPSPVEVSRVNRLSQGMYNLHPMQVGQVNLPLYGSLFNQATGTYIKGTYKSDTSQLIISNGIGVSSLRARWMCDPTIYYFTLRNN